MLIFPTCVSLRINTMCEVARIAKTGHTEPLFLIMAESKVLAFPINLHPTTLPKTPPESMEEPVVRGSRFV